MPLTGPQYQQIQDALLAAFDEPGLRRLVRQELDADLDAVAGGKNKTEVVLNLIDWAEREGRVADLIAGALKQNPTSPALQALAEAAQTWHLASPAEPKATPPYQGLAYFDVADADRFFGREKLTAELVAYLKNHRFLAIVGASGSGKSSVVRAGVVTALRKGEVIQGSDRWAAFIVTPTARPLETLAIALVLPGEAEDGIARFTTALRASTDSLHLRARRLLSAVEKPHVLLVIDQFEELFTLCKDKTERRAFIDNLLAAAQPDGVTTVILTLRADFYAHCAEYDNLRAALEQYQRYIGAMSPDELRAAIEKPAQNGAWDLESGLVNRVLRDVADEPGALPLLSHALLETWQRRSGRLLTLAGYEAAGGVRGAIAHTADATYAALTPDQQAIARSIFLRLTALGEGVQDTRRRVPLQELASLADVEAVLQKLEDARLVTAVREGEPDAAQPTTFVDVTHEALIREWPRLREWLAEDREGLRLHRKLTEAAQEWADLERDPGALYRGVQLQQAQEWAAGRDSELNDLERAFLAASVAEVVAVEARELQQARTARNRALMAFAGALAALILSVIVGWFFYQQYQATEGERLLKEARQLKEALDADGAIAKFQAAVAADPTLDIDMSAEISDTLRYVATTWVQEGEALLRGTSTLTASQPLTLATGIIIQPDYLAWAAATAPQIAGWSLDTPVVRQQAIISATALFSQALALNPPSDTPVYVWIPPGEFTMGSTDEQMEYVVQLCKDAGYECSPDSFSNEQESHEISLDGYWIQRTEVTNEQYKRCYDAGGCPDKPDDSSWDKPRNAKLPVTDVSWYQATKYAEWVGGRLPTEAEWEKACRGTGGSVFPWGDDPPTEELANYGGHFGNMTNVGTYAAGASPYGVLDMAGNVWEWTSSQYQLYPYNADDGREDQAGNAGRTLRGGSWSYTVGYVRCADRFWDLPDDGPGRYGFRLVTP